MKKSLNQLLILIVLCVSWHSVTAAQVENQSRILHPNGLLWKIEKADLRPSHIYGTMHVGHPRVINLAPQVESVFTSADRFVMEMLLNFEAVGVITAGSFFNDGRTLQSVMQEEDYQRLIHVLNVKLLMSEDVVKHMRPWAVFMTMMMPSDEQMNQESALDMVLYRRSALRKIPLHGLETAEEQLAVFESLSIQDQVWMLNKTVEELERSQALMQTMLDAYVDRDLAALVELQEKYMDEETDIDDRFMHELLDKRNIRMVERMQEYLQQGNAFIAIGALHLPGEKGVLHLLEQQGYRVTPVY